MMLRRKTHHFIRQTSCLADETDRLKTRALEIQYLRSFVLLLFPEQPGRV